MWEKIFNYGVYITRNCIQSAHFYSCLSSQLETLGKFFWKSVFHQDESGGGEYDLLYQNSIRKNEDDLEH